MTPQQFIQSEITNSYDSLSEIDQKELSSLGVEAFLYKKLTSKKFRKWRVDELSEKQVRRAIHLAVSTNKPLQFRYPFGGYKLWRLPSTPEVDWAEFFAIAYYLRYLSPIAAAYKPGLELVFSSDDLIIERMDNIPKADTDNYFASFKKLLNVFRPNLPSNLKVNIVRIADFYDDIPAMETELSANVEKFKQEYQDIVDDDKKQKMYTMSALNIKFDGAQDLTTLSADEKRAVIEMGPVYHDAYCSLAKRREFNRGDDKIVLFTTPIPNALAIGTTKTSVTKFWTGYGVLESKSDTFAARVLSPEQLASVTIDKTPVSIDGLTGKNFETIGVITPLFG
ncbi:hypothetical protein E6P97_01980 [Patescibacteria group bacterium]|nr:MAG: hypothetical protein E6P97_01980 [Patescibacteria group bacterium]